MEVWVVGWYDCEGSYIRSIHKTYAGAFKAWDRIRNDLLSSAKEDIESCKKKKRDKVYIEMYLEMIKNLSCDKPDKIDNHPWETPFLRRYIVED